MKKTAFLLAFFLFLSFLFSGCSGSASGPSPDAPVTLTMWHVFGEQAESPMNVLIEEFNNTVGREKGVLINVTAMSNASAIGQQLLDARDQKPGSGIMPDLFFCHPSIAEALGTGSLTDWKDCFSEQELSGFVPDFLKEGTLENHLTVFPVSKSTFLLFLNGTQFQRFSSACGITEADLSTWDGFYRAADAYYKWSGGKPFCAFDYPLISEMLEAEASGSDVIRSDGWFDPENDSFRKAALRFGKALAEGTAVLSDQYSNTQVMTGEVLAGISSSAAILYYNDTVTYPDNTSEPLNLKILPPPVASSGTPYATQAGVGLCALRADGKKQEAVSLFAHWLTESRRNLDFAVSAGYMPVRTDSFEQIPGHSFANEAYASLYDALSEVRNTCTFRTDPSNPVFYQNVEKVYAAVREKQAAWHARFLKGEQSDALSMEYWQVIVSAG